jgi:DNA recombination protein RmuC
MQQGLAGILPLVVALLMGIVGGAVLVNMLIGARIRSMLPDITHANTVETMGLDKLAAPAEVHQVVPDRDQIQQLEAKLATSETQLKTSEEKRAELADKVAQLEDKFAQSEERVAKLQETSSKPEAELSPTVDQDAKISVLQAEHASAISSMEKEISSLQERLQERSKESEERESALEEKVSLVAKLEQQQKDDSAEIARLKQDAKDSRDKWEASVAQVEKQQKAIERIETEKSELFTKRDQMLQEHEGLRANLSELNSLLDAERDHTTEKLVLLERAKEQLSNTFKCLASEMVEEKVVAG